MRERLTGAPICQLCQALSEQALHDAGPKPGRDPCKHGTPLYLAYESARRDLAGQKRLDSQPLPGQGTLF